ncbi:MAG: ester cyclase [Actinomycetota bacterium]|nr:ester cyclase [Actinomycetota bacterium]
MHRFYRDVWNGWDDRAVDALLAPGFALRGSLGDEAHGREGFRAYRDKVHAAFGDFHNEVRELIVDGERAAVRLTCTGRHDGEILGLAPTGARVAYEAAAFFRTEGGYLQEAWVLGDLDGLRAQLTAAPRDDA